MATPQENILASYYGADPNKLFTLPGGWDWGNIDIKGLERATGHTLGSGASFNYMAPIKAGSYTDWRGIEHSVDTTGGELYKTLGLDPNKEYVSGKFRSVNPEDDKYGYQRAIWEKRGDQYVPVTASADYERAHGADTWTKAIAAWAAAASAVAGGAALYGAYGAGAGAGVGAGAGGAAEAGGAAAAGGGGGGLTGTGGYGLSSGTAFGGGSGISASGAGAATGSGLGATTGAGTTLAATTGTGMGLSEGLAAGLYGGSGLSGALDYAKQAYDLYGKGKKVQNAYNLLTGGGSSPSGPPGGGQGGQGGQGMAGMVSAPSSPQRTDLSGLLGNPQLGAAAAQERQFLNQSYAPIAREEQRRGLARGLAGEWNV